MKFMKQNFTTIAFLLMIGTINSQNPIVPPGVYIADPSAHVWNDGKLYVYGLDFMVKEMTFLK
jgi:arabinoxylan arabinofuranohydrolase